MSFLVLEGIGKSFGSFTALDQVDLAVDRGTVRALLGENGAGKTTLMNVLYGLYRPTSGSIRIDNKPIYLRSPSDAIANGIGMIPQHVQLAEALTVAENIILGLGRGMSMLDVRRHARRISELSEAFGLEIDPATEVWKLPLGMRQRVEILKVLYRGADILVLDEPTSILAPNEIDTFLHRMGLLRDSGKTILFVTHKLDEVMALADDVTVMRQGRVVATCRTADTDPVQLSRLMVGRDVPAPATGRTTRVGDVALECHDLRMRNERGTTALDGLSIVVRSGEILGIAGVDGNGQRELAEAICGLKRLDAGMVRARGVDVTGFTAEQRHRTARIGLVPEDRHGTGLVLDNSIASNLVLRSFRRPPIARCGVLDGRAIARNAADLMNRYDIRARSAAQSTRDLSGGNQQKIVLAREIEARPDVLVVAQATKGLDIGAIDFVHGKLLEERDRGAAILYISTELEHIAEVADRIAFICRGRITGELRPDELTAERAGLLMSGGCSGEAA
jgi:ABC-type uncharacterized transport system ATPase subunit